MADLFDGDNENSDEELKINKGYANNYNNWRQKEELNKLKTKYGEHLDELNSDDESSSSSDDEDATCLTEKCEKGFLDALSHLEKKDPIIYDENVDFFADIRNADNNEIDSIDDSAKIEKKEKKKPLYLRDYERKIITERNGKFSDSEEEETDKNIKNNDTIKVPYVEEQRQILESIKQQSKNIDDDNDIFECKSKSKSQMDEESDDELLNKPDKTDRSKKKSFQNVWTDPKLSSDEKFLRDYVLNNKFLDEDAENNIDDCHVGDDILSEDEKYIEENQEFEHKYNYRFEEPDQEFIKRYPRTMDNSLRKKDTRRAQKRVEIKQRKEEEKVRQKEELKQLKALKRKEIMDKIDQLKEITGNDDMKLDILDWDGDFDPAEHDRKMQELFNDEYYKTDENIKPEFPELDEELGIDTTWDTYDPNSEEITTTSNDFYTAPHCEDTDFNMDADYDANKSLHDELIGASKKKRRRRSKFAEVIAKKKPTFNPDIHPSFKDYIDQYYALDYEDMIGDLPCRFKYRSVVPNDYGLSVEEILMADDKELNKWCSLKKALEHKSEEMELNEVRIFKQKANNETYKQKVLQSLYKPPDETNNDKDDSTVVKTQINDDNSEVDGANKKKRKRKKKKSDAATSQVDVKSSENGEKVSEIEKKSLDSTESMIDKKKKKLKRSAEQTDDNNSVKNSHTEIKRQKIDKSVTTKRQNVKEINKQTDKIVSKKLLRKAKFQQRQHDNKKQTDKNPVALLSDERLKAYKINPRKFKNKLKYGKKN